jgi:hypothetical protein
LGKFEDDWSSQERLEFKEDRRDNQRHRESPPAKSHPQAREGHH